MSELQPGMLAMVVGCRSNPANIGKVVELVRFMAPNDMHDGRRFAGPVSAWKIKGDGLVFLNLQGSTYESDCSYAESRHLMPVKPEQDKMETKQNQELHA